MVDDRSLDTNHPLVDIHSEHRIQRDLNLDDPSITRFHANKPANHEPSGRRPHIHTGNSDVHRAHIHEELAVRSNRLPVLHMHRVLRNRGWNTNSNRSQCRAVLRGRRQEETGESAEQFI